MTRKGILEMALGLLEGSPRADLSMRALAKELGAAPMSLWRRVLNRDDPLHGLGQTLDTASSRTRRE